MKNEISNKMNNDFDSGVRAMFDFFMQNACRFHANLALNTECRKENKLISELAEDALEEVSPETLKKWKDISKLQQEITRLENKIQDLTSKFNDSPVTCKQCHWVTNASNENCPDCGSEL